MKRSAWSLLVVLSLACVAVAAGPKLISGPHTATYNAGEIPPGLTAGPHSFNVPTDRNSADPWPTAEPPDKELDWYDTPPYDDGEGVYWDYREGGTDDDKVLVSFNSDGTFTETHTDDQGNVVGTYHGTWS